MVIDGLFSMFGSSNLDGRSSEINEELDVVVYDENFGREMESVFEKDLAQSREYTLEEFKKRTLWERYRMAHDPVSFAVLTIELMSLAMIAALFAACEKKETNVTNPTEKKETSTTTAVNPSPAKSP